MTETAVFVCNICNEPSSDICIACTKDACQNHRCERCHRCSDCCDCDIPLTEQEPEAVHVPEVATVPFEAPLNGVETVEPAEPPPLPSLEIVAEPPQVLPIQASDFPGVELEPPPVEKQTEVHEHPRQGPDEAE